MKRSRGTCRVCGARIAMARGLLWPHGYRRGFNREWSYSCAGSGKRALASDFVGTGP